ncbi:ribosomal protein S6 kinase-like 1 isoform X1 [Carcharodon carcharias]|uniref:ribosomal protein S6 kinase-like 1 isoform X1 n=1 Tax=Carcharodon carcharias TaxID=13397 RepID=UPI001B7F3ECE|nr:ribosomal protein S6 kinase-like 1 isoform X1 [Carcharodon carcharias]XP_041070438.1 ribosomal protein S6 kinase-like 1 isoform X1 [Carcharodon carcharias]XP_041070439.1 ribosomal protein S6 kinase-like 1 isoform X1 [Carcharodon carcharias]XP_041070440.1 ribosomal protein S6 kinase-like 1 isoform X1 [Carcharodon carcharias]
MYSLAGERPTGQDAEPCSRPLSQARVYLEQIRSRVSPSMQEGQATRSIATKRDYLVDAAKQIRLALDREVNEDYEAAFNYYKNGVDLLLKGVQVDPNKERREAVKRKTTQYLKRAEEIFNSHLQGSLGNGTDDSGGFSSLRFRPNRILSSPVEDLKMSKVIAIIDKVLLVQNPSTNEPFIVKSLPKCSLVNRERQTIIPQGVPFMVRLLQYYVSDDAVLLHLEHVPAGKLWPQLRHSCLSITEKGMEFPECSSPNHKTIKLKNSYTAPSLSSMYNDNSILTSNSERDWQRETKTETNKEYDKYGYSTDGISNPQLRTQQRLVNDQSSNQINGRDQLNTQNESVNKANIWQGKNGISKGCIGLNGLRGNVEGTSLQVTQLIYSDHVNFDLTALLSEKDAELTHSSKTVNHAMTITVDRLLQKDLQSENSQLLYEGKILRPHDCFLETKSSNTTLSPKLSKTHQSQAASDLLKEKALLVNEESWHGSSPIRSPVRATSLNLKASRRQGQRGSYQITVNPLDTIENSSKVSCVMDNSELVLVGSSSAMPVRNTAVTVLGRGQSEQKTSVSVLSPVQKPNALLISSLPVIEPPTKSLKLKGISTNEVEVLNFEGENPERIDHQLKLLNQIPVSEICCDHENCNSRAILSKTCLCRAENGRSSNRISGSLAPDKAEDEETSSLTPQHPKAELSIPSQASFGLSEDQIRIWAAEMVLALESLHQQGIICLDLNPRNILVDNAGHVCLTYFGQWSEVEVQCSTKAVEDMYCAPEVGGVGGVTEACDWWSLGALLFELLTGMTLSQCYPSRIHPHTQLRLPDHLSPAAVSLLQQLLQWNYHCRLGSGENGTQEIKSHSFFSSVQWNKLNGYR